MSYNSNVKLVIRSNFAKIITFPHHIRSKAQLGHVEQSVEASHYILEKFEGNLPQ